MTSLTHTRLGPSQHGIAKRATDCRSHQRLTEAYHTALHVPFDDHTPLVIFSDHHRGDRSRLDSFAANHDLFVHALRRYYDQGFSYIKAGDGDELWKGWRFGDVERAHGPVFDLLHRFQRQDRLHLLYGNHEELAEGGYQQDKGGLPVREAVVLERLRTSQRLFVVHGHQADPRNDNKTQWSRRFVRCLWTPVQNTGQASLSGSVHPVRFGATETISQRIEAWAAVQRQLVICGHTHRPVFARPGAAPYFNSGACLHPGQITGIEIAGGYIQLVRWFAAAAGSASALRRCCVTPPIPLDAYC
jgi:UDP-2,3-diacylglucosamine pyrophosphatase LpxH